MILKDQFYGLITSFITHFFIRPISYFDGNFDASFYGNFDGNCDGNFNGNFDGNFDEKFDENFDQNYDGNFDGNLDGSFDGNFDGKFYGILIGILMVDSMGWPYDSYDCLLYPSLFGKGIYFPKHRFKLVMHRLLALYCNFVFSEQWWLPKNCHECQCSEILNDSNSFASIPRHKNPAYGRQSIFRPMRIVAPIPQ